MKRWFGAILLVLACAAPAGAAEQPVAFEDIEYTLEQLGPAEFERGMSKLYGRKVQWKGWVEEIDPLNKGAADGKRPVSVLMHLGSVESLGTARAVFLVSPDQLKLVRKGLMIRFTGEIRVISVRDGKKPGLRVTLDKVRLL